jgi:uncharacterized protein (TIRG00374 family)
MIERFRCGRLSGRTYVVEVTKRSALLTSEKRLGLLKTIPGLLVSAFFIWWTYIRVGANGKRGFDPAAFRGLHVVSWMGVAGVVVFGIAGYTIRCYRCWAMLRGAGAKFTVCARVFMTSLAANNVLPLRIGDVMRIFTYAEDQNATPSMVLSTVILEKLLDVFSLAVLFVVTMHFGQDVPARVHTLAEVGVVLSTAGLAAMVFGSRMFEVPLQRLFAKTQHATLKKAEHWVMLALGCVRQIGVVGTLMLVLYSFAAWACECLMYIAMARATGLVHGIVGPAQATAEANLSFLIPSSPGGIGPFELACKDALMRHGASVGDGALFGLVIHVWLLLSITGVGGALFFMHRMHRAKRASLITEIETLPADLP